MQAWIGHLGATPENLDPAALRRQLSRGTIPDVLAQTARTHPDSTLTIEEATITYADLRARAARAASVLAEHGVVHGERVVISAPTSMAFVVAYLAGLRLGAVMVLTNPGFTTSELNRVVDRCDPVIVLTDDQLARTTSVPVFRMDDLIEATESAAEHPPVGLDSRDVALLAFTSGTTGLPKGVPLTHGQLLASIRSAMLAWRWNSQDILVHALPLFHQHGLSGIHVSLLAGSKAGVLARFDPDRLLETIARTQATVMFAVPSIHQRLVALDREQLAPLRRLRLATSGSAPLSATLARAYFEKVGMMPLERYGLTETGLNVSNNYEGERTVGAVGYPLPGVEVALTDVRGHPVEVGTEGEIVLRGPQVFDGYLDDPAATDAAFWPGQWFRTGDLGRWDDEGLLIISGRLKELVITGGMNVVPTEVERVIEQLPGVREAAVAGLPSERWGEEVATWVVARAGQQVSSEQILAHCLDHLAAYKCPKRVFFLDQLPRNAMGKVTRNQLVPSSRA
ncbi:MAG: acyl--CoA ligase [Flavobacterium sp.]|nr:acyl--CoA ligase [Aeromicrobium sp.]